MARSANYSVVDSTRGELVIRDDGPHDRHKSVTNDAENVVRELHGAGQLPPGRKLLYFDSQGDLDEIKHDGQGGFIGFAPGPRR